MYRYLDSLLVEAKKKLRREFNSMGQMGFDELNVVNTKKFTKAMFDRLLSTNEKLYLKAGRDAYAKAKKSASAAGYAEQEELELDAGWLAGVLMAYSLVTGYLYKQEAERKRLRLNEQVLTAREYDSREMFNQGLRRSANLWWTQTQQYGIEVVDEATIQAFRDMGVKRVRWVATEDERICQVCKSRSGKIYDILKVPEKTHYNCRCYLEPIEVED